MPRRTFHRGSGIYSYMGEGGGLEQQEKTQGVRGALAVLGLSPLYPDSAASASSPQGPQVPSWVKAHIPLPAHLLKGQVCLVGRWP